MAAGNDRYAEDARADALHTARPPALIGGVA